MSTQPSDIPDAAAADVAPSRTATALQVGALLGLFLLGHLNWRTPTLRFSDAAANAWALVATFALPWLALALGGRVLTRSTRILFVACLVPLLAYTGPVGLVLAFNAATVMPGRPAASLVPVHSIDVAGGRAVLYRTDCGATCNYGVVLRQERRLVPGLLLVRNLASWYPAYEGTLTRPTDGRVEARVRKLSHHGGPRSTPSVVVTQLMPWVYF